MKKFFLFAMFVSSVSIADSGSQKGTELPQEAREVLTEMNQQTATASKDEAPIVVPAKSEGPAIEEKEIPLNLEKKKTQIEESHLFTRLIFSGVVLLLMLVGAYFFFKRYGKPGPKKNAPQMKVLTQHWLGPKKSLAVVNIAGESVLIGITDHHISLIKTLSLLDDELPQDLPTQFQETLHQVDKSGSDARPQHQTQARNQNRMDSRSETRDVEEDFEMKGLGQIRDVVSRRLKNMRTLN